MAPLRRATVGGVVVGALLVAAAPTPAAALTTLRTSPSAPDAVLPMVALAALIVWSLLCWLVLVTAVVLASRLPGVVGGAAGTAARRIAPAAVRQLVEGALGLSVAAGILAAPPASASPSIPPAPPAASASLDWPAAVPFADQRTATAPALDWNPTAVPTSTSDPVVVQPGDCLWGVAARHLPADATPAQIAQDWPSWWAANRDSVGPNPDLIHPGLELHPPTHA